MYDKQTCSIFQDTSTKTIYRIYSFYATIRPAAQKTLAPFFWKRETKQRLLWGSFNLWEIAGGFRGWSDSSWHGTHTRSKLGNDLLPYVKRQNQIAVGLSKRKRYNIWVSSPGQGQETKWQVWRCCGILPSTKNDIWNYGVYRSCLQIYGKGLFVDSIDWARSLSFYI